MLQLQGFLKSLILQPAKFDEKPSLMQPLCLTQKQQTVGIVLTPAASCFTCPHTVCSNTSRPRDAKVILVLCSAARARQQDQYGR